MLTEHRKYTLVEIYKNMILSINLHPTLRNYGRLITVGHQYVHVQPLFKRKVSDKKSI